MSGDVQLIMDTIGCGPRVANDLLTLAGGDADLVIKCSKKATGLDQCKVLIIDLRFTALEDDYNC